MVVLERGQPGDQVMGDREAAGGQSIGGRWPVIWPPGSGASGARIVTFTEASLRSLKLAPTMTRKSGKVRSRPCRFFRSKPVRQVARLTSWG